MRRIVVLLGLLMMLMGCGVYRSGPVQVVDPLVERHQRWQSLIDQGNRALEQGQLDEALQYYQRSLEQEPDHAEVHLKIAQIYFKQQEYEKAARAFQESLKYDPDRVEAWNYLGYVNETLQRYEQAVEAFHAALERDPQNLYALNHMGLAYRQLGRLDQAEAVLRTALSIDPECKRPENRNTHNYLGLVYESRGDIAQAIAEFRESIRLFPDDTWATNHLATLLENQGRSYEALLWYQKTLEHDPENVLAKQRIQALQLAGAPSMADIPPVELLPDEVQDILNDVPDAEDYPEADAIVLLNQFSHDVLEDGRSRYTTHKLIKVLTERGVLQYADFAMPFNARSQNVAVNIARTILPDGTVLEPPDEAYSDVTPPGLLSYNLYSDMMWKVVSMPGVVPGAILEYQATVEDAEGTTEGKKVWFWGEMEFQSTEPVLRSICAVRVPKDKPLAWRVYQVDLEPEIRATDTHLIYVWRAGTFPPLPNEPAIADLADKIPRLSYASVQTWEQISRWYRDLAQDRYEPDAAIQTLTHLLTQGLEDPDEQLRAVYRFVATKIRYVGIEYGQGAYQPSPAAEVLRHRYGDCKDKATLLISMLEILGQKAYPVLLQPRPYPAVDRSLPSPSQFSHVIVAVPRKEKGYLWLDPTAPYARFGDLPYNDQGRTALVIGETDGELAQTPSFPPERNRIEVRSHLKLTEDGSVVCKEVMIFHGETNQLYRTTYTPLRPADRKNIVAMELASRYPGAELEHVAFRYLEDPDQPLALEIRFRIPETLNPANVLALSLGQPDLNDYASLVALPERQWALDLGYPVRFEQSTVFEFPAGWRLLRAPETGRWESTLGFYEQEVVLDANHLRWNSRFEIQQSQVSPADYPEAKRFLEQAARASQEPLILTRSRT